MEGRREEGGSVIAGFQVRSDLNGEGRCARPRSAFEMCPGIGVENVQDEESAQETLKELEVMSPRKRSRCTYLSPDFL